MLCGWQVFKFRTNLFEKKKNIYIVKQRSKNFLGKITKNLTFLPSAFEKSNLNLTS